MTPQRRSRQQQVLVLGGGLMGLAVAHGLARHGWSVHLLRRGRREAAGFAAAGMLAPHAEGLGGPLLTLGQRSLRMIPAWVSAIEEDSGLPCGWLSCGTVAPFTSQAQRQTFPTAALGHPLDRAALEAEAPGISPAFTCGLLFPQDGQLDNRRQLMAALEQACRRRGVRFTEGVTVERLCGEEDGGGHRHLVGIALRTGDGERQKLSCGQAVLCCGAWSQQLLPQVPVMPVKGQMFSVQAPRQALRRVLFGPGTYLVPRQDGLVVVGATSEQVGFTPGLTPMGQSRLEQGLRQLLPVAARWPPMERWYGFRPCTRDQQPVLGPGPLAGLVMATGHHRNGVLLAAVTAELTRIVLETGPAAAGCHNTPWAAPFLHAFRWNRFSPAPAQASVRQV
ncbi:MAG: glycine oxidase ThiO [Synechococcus sp. SB0668_bin_15]|nr:glycine oxidase ThiO [Synechococcus sp. SB0668_bin_15]MXZ82684.1 glycine oxidase ThiO [Synechococcus sp. SB0666_bin_14]MYA91360.1 glycine oxidase ThiO [Synechococcus sp. SB0663_bin_10]MYC48730.1 glycine oxidase ThiO [Synechococcus sp. SB0662_bin_14]MYG47048.1 glycine oxidase ThiO [Synechococcus sp. SB0675_bin_6]MYJ59746.1 glycine oxidase ThiO [Synechococcus sp. SB0672_bin_6]MYK91083.1 glycine oxidase ThiO [Synechococcus sp. SB0669_bin_8]